MATISFTVPAVPVAQPRPQAVKFRDRARVHEVTHIKQSDGSRKPHPINAYKATVAHAARLAYDGPPLTGPLAMHLVFAMPRPKSMRWKTKPMPRVPCCRKPDIDNLFKSTVDALIGVVFADDSQIYEGSMQKLIAAGDEQPHCEITITELTPPLGG